MHEAGCKVCDKTLSLSVEFHRIYYRLCAKYPTNTCEKTLSLSVEFYFTYHGVCAKYPYKHERKDTLLPASSACLASNSFYGVCTKLSVWKDTILSVEFYFTYHGVCAKYPTNTCEKTLSLSAGSSCKCLTRQKKYDKLNTVKKSH